VTVGDRIGIAALAAAIGSLGLGAWLLFGSGAVPGTADGELLDPFSQPPMASLSAAGVVVDVEGGVLRPGIVRLDDGSRVADAIAAAGGYSPAADLLAAAAQINLAAPLHDGQQILVPRLGETTPGTAGGSGATGGLVDLNHASADALDALPGIGPATVAKIVAARTEQPFETLDELVSRKVLTSAQLEQIRDLVTIG